MATVNVGEQALESEFALMPRLLPRAHFCANPYSRDQNRCAKKSSNFTHLTTTSIPPYNSLKMADEVYDGAIGIDLGTLLRDSRCEMREFIAYTA